MKRAAHILHAVITLALVAVTCELYVQLNDWSRMSAHLELTLDKQAGEILQRQKDQIKLMEYMLKWRKEQDAK